MDIESFFTIQNKTANQNNAAKKPLAAGTEFGLQGIEFIDLILSHTLQAMEDSEQAKTSDDENSLLRSDNPALTEEAGLDPATLLADNPEITEAVDNYKLDTPDEIETTLSLNQQAFDEILKAIENEFGIDTDTESGDYDFGIEDGVFITTEIDPEDQEFLSALKSFLIDNQREPGNTNQLKALSKKLSQLEGQDFQIINLTPAQLTELQQQLEGLDLKGENIGEFTAMLVKIVPSQPEQNVIITQNSLIIASGQVTGEQLNKLRPANDLATQLNSLTVGGEEPPLITPVKPEGEAKAQSFAPPGEDGVDPELDQILKQFTSNDEAKAAKANSAMAKEGDATQQPGHNPNLSVLQGWPFTMNGSLYLASNWAFGIDEYGGQNGSAIINNTAQYANLMTQAQSAGQAHPGSQMVAATIQKSASTPENRSIKIQLDPPELGRVEVRMEFSKGKSMKATVISEKPETHLMLQRDAHILERALQDASIEGEGADLNFEMAGEDHDFNHNGGHDGQGPMGQSPDDEELDMDIIESTMTWQVNPETGHTSYNILA